MTFDKRLRDGVRNGQITCSIRIWMRPKVKAGGRYRMEQGEIIVHSIQLLGSLERPGSSLEQFPEITPEVIRESGFLSEKDLLAIAKHGKGEDVYLIRFYYEGPQ